MTIFLAQSLCRNYHLTLGQLRCAIKLDIKKAFDTFNWSFLFKAMEAMGFPIVFINWIKGCIETAMLFIKINGSLEGYFKAKYGLRQGDPLSPYLFVIAMKVLTACLNHATTNVQFQYHWKTKDIALSHLIFADDVFLFCKGETNSIGVLMAGVTLFSSISGLVPSREKSNVSLLMCLMW